MTLAKHVNRATTAKLITFVKDDACCFICPAAFALLFVKRRVEGLRVDNHHVYTCIAGKCVNLAELFGVIYEVLHSLAVIFLGKMLLHTLKAFQHTFTDGDTWYNHHEFRPAVTLVQLVHGLDVGIGLTCTCFHFDGERHANAL